MAYKSDGHTCSVKAKTVNIVKFVGYMVSVTVTQLCPFSTKAAPDNTSLVWLCWEGNGNPVQYSCLENPTDKGVWWAVVHGVARVAHDLATNPPGVDRRSMLKQTPCEWCYYKAPVCKDTRREAPLWRVPALETPFPSQKEHALLENGMTTKHMYLSLYELSPWT